MGHLIAARQEIKVGVRIDLDEGVRLFGTEDVNALISKGWRVTGMREGGAIFMRMGEGEGTSRLVLSGCDMTVILEPSTDH